MTAAYKKDPKDAKHWLVDEEAAAVVRRIFQMVLNGYGTEQIATKLTGDHILTPIFYAREKGVGRPCKESKKPPYHWSTPSVTKILSAQEYCGDIINFKTYSKSYKNKKRLDNAPEDWAVFRDVNTPIVDRTTFELVQQKRGKARKVTPKEVEPSIFSGVLVCADCGHNLHFHFNQRNPEIRYYVCANYKGNRGTCNATHYVRVDFLEQVVLGEIRRLTRYASKHETEFLQAMSECSSECSLDVAAEASKRKRRELAALIARDKELDVLFERLYEDNVSGKISDARFKSVSTRYDDEQAALKQRVRELKAELEKEESRALTTDAFLAIVRKYTRAKKLTARMLNELELISYGR